MNSMLFGLIFISFIFTKILSIKNKTNIYKMLKMWQKLFQYIKKNLLKENRLFFTIQDRPKRQMISNVSEDEQNSHLLPLALLTGEQFLCYINWFWIYYYSGEGNGTPLQYSCLENPMDGGAWKAVVHGVAEGRTQLTDFTFTFHFPALEKEMATHSSVLAWRIPGMGEPGGLPSMGSHRVGHD